MDALYWYAGGLAPWCATALANHFDSEVDGGAAANCDCWNAMGETYRNDNFGCMPEGDDWTINQLYVQQCQSQCNFEPFPYNESTGFSILKTALNSNV